MLENICLHLVSQYNKDPEKSKYSLRTKTICASYATGADRSTNLPTWKKLEWAIEQGIRLGYWYSVKNKDGIYVTINSTKDMVQSMVDAYHFTTVLDYENTIRSVLTPYADSYFKVLRAWVNNELANGFPDCQRWWPLRPNLKMTAVAAELFDLVRVAEAILNLDDEMLIRNFSVQHCKGSKDFSATYENRVCRILAPDMPAVSAPDREAILSNFHLVKNPSHVLVRGTGCIEFFNGGKLFLTPIMGHVALSASMVNTIVAVYASSLLTIENLTTFHDYHQPKDELLVCTMGQPNHAVTNFVGKYLSTAGKSSFTHFGDFDGFGFAIIETLGKRTGADVLSRHMDKDTYLKNIGNGIALPERNIPLLERLIQSSRFHAEQKETMHTILDKKLLLEQESIMLQN